MHRTSTKSGFSLIELVIVIIVIAILAAIATPSYFSYVRRIYIAEIIQATEPFKTGVTECFQKTADLSRCTAGSNHVPAAITTETGAVASLTVKKGVIIVMPVPRHGILATDTYVLTPTIKDNKIVWTASGVK